MFTDIELSSCSALCTIENGYACTNYTNFPDSCCATLQLCGNGIRDRCEQCDDGNPFSNDGCSPYCQSEILFKCRDGCNGPLCFSEDFCSGGFVGKKKQVCLYCLHHFACVLYETHLKTRIIGLCALCTGSRPRHCPLAGHK